MVSSPLIKGNNIALRVKVSEKTAVSIFLINVEGKIVLKIPTTVSSASADLLIDIPTLAAGVYYIVGSANGIKTNVIRLIKL